MKHPAFFLGANKSGTYFEGWYFKCISKDRRHAVALIPGMAVTPEGVPHGFVQVIHAETGRTYYFDFPYSDFSAATDRFDVAIRGNRFSSTGLVVDLSQTGIGEVRGALHFSACREYPTSLLHPGIMGPFSFLPNMECNHVIIHLSHNITGTLTLDGQTLDFTDGAGYIEKDYGRSFPKEYVWIQASHFDRGEASFVFSQARIPFLRTWFPGFFAYFSDFTATQVRFATYNFSKLIRWEINKENGTCQGCLKGPGGMLEFKAEMSGGGKLRAPVDGQMNREIIESIGAHVEIRLTDRRGTLRYLGSSGEAGMEISL